VKISTIDDGQQKTITLGLPKHFQKIKSLAYFVLLIYNTQVF
jgi:hypothetical protein